MKKTTKIISVFLCFILTFSSSAIAVQISPDYFKVDDISISHHCGILEGNTFQLTATLSPENASQNAVEWFSDNPKAISCSKDGIIKAYLTEKVL